MAVIIFAATDIELQPTRRWVETTGFSHPAGPIECVITGPGILASCFSITSTLLNRKPDWAIQAGIAGTLSPSLQIGDTVLVKDEMIGDMGVREASLFKDLFDLGLQADSAFPFVEKKLPNPSIERWPPLQLPAVHGVTVNQITTDPSVLFQYQNNYHLDIESMEGASLHYAAATLHVPFLQIRSISNKAGERDKKKWRIQEAITVLNETLIHLLNELR